MRHLYMISELSNINFVNVCVTSLHQDINISYKFLQGYPLSRCPGQLKFLSGQSYVFTQCLAGK